jgi:hypothetical protein
MAPAGTAQIKFEALCSEQSEAAEASAAWLLAASACIQYLQYTQPFTKVLAAHAGQKPLVAANKHSACHAVMIAGCIIICIPCYIVVI